MFSANSSLFHSLIFIAAIVCSISPVSSQAASLKPDPIANSTVAARDRLIFRGIAAYDAGYYGSAVYLLRNFLNRHKIIRTPLEQTGINYLALAYQATGNEIQARETILRGIAAENKTSLERANLEYTAGLIAIEQQETAIANQHWQTARRFYLINGDRLGWIKTTLGLAKNYQESGNFYKSRQMLSELDTEKRQSHVVPDY